MTEAQFAEVMKQLATKPHRDRAIWTDDLPDPARYPTFRTVTLPRESVAQFREQYGTMLGVIAFLAGKVPQEVTLFDIMCLVDRWRALERTVEQLGGGR